MAAALPDEKYVALTTFKRDGTPVTTPVWIARLPDGRCGCYTESGSGKAKRLRHTPKVVLQASTYRGLPTEGSHPVDATATLVTGADLEALKVAIGAKYGLMTKIVPVLAKLRHPIKTPPYADQGIIFHLPD